MTGQTSANRLKIPVPAEMKALTNEPRLGWCPQRESSKSKRVSFRKLETLESVSGSRTSFAPMLSIVLSSLDTPHWLCSTRYKRMCTIIQPMCIVAAYFISDRPIIGPGGMLIRCFPSSDKEKEVHHSRWFCTWRGRIWSWSSWFSC